MSQAAPSWVPAVLAELDRVVLLELTEIAERDGRLPACWDEHLDVLQAMIARTTRRMEIVGNAIQIVQEATRARTGHSGRAEIRGRERGS